MECIEFIQDEDDFTKYFIFQTICGTRYKIKSVPSARIPTMKEKYVQMYGKNVTFKMTKTKREGEINKDVKSMSDYVKEFCSPYYFCKQLDSVIKFNYQIKVKNNKPFVRIKYHNEYRIMKGEELNVFNSKYLNDFVTTSIYNEFITFDSVKNLVKKLKLSGNIVLVPNFEFNKYVTNIRKTKKDLKDSIL